MVEGSQPRAHPTTTDVLLPPDQKCPDVPDVPSKGKPPYLPHQSPGPFVVHRAVTTSDPLPYL